MSDSQRRSGTDVEGALRELNTATVASVPGARHAGLTLVDKNGDVATYAATDHYPALLDEIQAETGEGPCLSAAWTQHTIVIDDLEAETRWPKYKSEALRRTPIRAVMSFQLHSQGGSLAALNFYAPSPRVFDAESIEMGVLLAAHTSQVWNSLQRERQFSSALANRDSIGQAKGILMERYDLDAIAAFELLRKISQGTNTKINVLADRLIESRRVRQTG